MSDPSSYEKFVKMMKMNVPEMAIRQKMAGEGFSTNEIEKFIASGGVVDTPPKSVGGKQSIPHSTSLSSHTSDLTDYDENPLDPAQIANDDRFVGFVQMLKLNLPDEAIKAKMQLVGFHPHEIDALFVSQGRQSVFVNPTNSNFTKNQTNTSRNTPAPAFGKEQLSQSPSAKRNNEVSNKTPKMIIVIKILTFYTANIFVSYV
jgi:hypothetical protein